MSLQEAIARRASLIERITQQREELQVLTEVLERPIGWIDKGYGFAQKIRQKPMLSLGAALLSVLVLRKQLPVIKIGAKLLKIAKWWFSLK